MTRGNRVAFKSSILTITLIVGMKMIAVDSGRTFIVSGISSPNRGYGDSVQNIPALTYVTADEYL